MGVGYLKSSFQSKNREFKVVIQQDKRLLRNTLFIASLSVLASCDSNNQTSTVTNTNTQQEFLPVDKAFMYSANAENKHQIRAHWVIAEGYHLYKDKFKFSVAPNNYKIVDIKYPKAEMFSDKNLGKLESYKDSVEVSIEITGEPTAEIISLTSTYQGCADVGLCYPPETKVSDFNLTSL